MLLPDGKDKLTKFSLDLIDDCRVSVGTRQSLAQYQTIIIEAGRMGGRRALVNKLVGHCDRLSSYLFSPTDLRFHVSFERHYEKDILSWADMASRIITKQWKRKDTDLAYGMAVRPQSSTARPSLKW